MYRIDKFIETKSRLLGARGCGEEKQKVTANRWVVSFVDEENVLELGSGDGCTVLNTPEPLNCPF
jgi:hypothetical protein